MHLPGSIRGGGEQQEACRRGPSLVSDVHLAPVEAEAPQASFSRCRQPGPSTEDTESSLKRLFRTQNALGGEGSATGRPVPHRLPGPPWLAGWEQRLKFCRKMLQREAGGRPAGSGLDRDREAGKAGSLGVCACLAPSRRQ